MISINDVLFISFLKVSPKFDDRPILNYPRLPNIIVFSICVSKKFYQKNSFFLDLVCVFFQLQNSSGDRFTKKISVETQLVSFSFLVRLINRLFDLHSNYTVIAKHSSPFKCNFIVADDFDVDGCLMNALEENESSPLEFLVYEYPRTKDEIQTQLNDWDLCETQTNTEENFEIISIQNDSIIVSIKSKDHRQETFLQKATGLNDKFDIDKNIERSFLSWSGWLHGSVHSPTRSSLTKKEFLEMMDPSTGRLIDEVAFRQYVFDYGCDESIRKIVWCYLLRVFNESMSHEDKDQYVKKTRERYNE